MPPCALSLAQQVHHLLKGRLERSLQADGRERVVDSEQWSRQIRRAKPQPDINELREFEARTPQRFQIAGCACDVQDHGLLAPIEY